MPKAPSQRGLAATNGSRLGEFRELPPQALRASSPKGTPFGGGGKVSGIAKNPTCEKAERIQNRLLPGMRRTKQCAAVPHFSSVENHRLCPFSTPGFSPGRYVENCPGQDSRLEKSKPVSRSKL